MLAKLQPRSIEKAPVKAFPDELGACCYVRDLPAWNRYSILRVVMQSLECTLMHELKAALLNARVDGTSNGNKRHVFYEHLCRLIPRK